MRAAEPTLSGHVERDGVKVSWEVFGSGEQTLMFLPSWSIVHSRVWKAQVPYFARHHRVVTFDGRGNGGSDRPQDPAAYREQEFAADALAVLDATQTDRAVLVSFSLGAVRALHVATDHPARVAGAVFIAPSAPIAPQHSERTVHSFTEPIETEEGWAKFNAHYWKNDYRGFLEFFFSRVFPEPHSTKPIEDCVGWGLQTTPETLIATASAPGMSPEEVLELCGRVQCPVLVLHGDGDEISPHARGEELARATGGSFVTLEGSGHAPHARDPVQVNLRLRDFLQPAPPPAVWTRGRSRRRRALYISSPIGLGHARRDVAIARELRARVPGLEIDWLAQHPVSRVLEAEGERIHPASAFLASESSHIEAESAGHDLHCFQAIRRMDEILVANFMVFHDVVREESYDLWIGDEAWEVDYYLHENPELKTAAYAWLTDFVGWLPMPDGGVQEARLTADYNAEMIEHIARYPRVRNRALFVGNPDDIVPDRFGPDLPLIRDWTEDHFDFTGYISGFDPNELPPRARLRAELGYEPHEQVCIVSVGGSGVGTHLLDRVAAAYDAAKQRVPALRMIIVAGPRIDPGHLPQRDGLEVRSYVHDLYRHFTACDLAI
ncbi:MAG TPA: alpha/beta fold hydrolase, partial [Vicinamibacterales bacterium]|nr:alpha/beta fold hydrolase [Vicinamibacterales bacterium]